MNQPLDKKRAELLKRISRLPEKTQHAFSWLIANYDTAMRLCQTEKLTEEERKQLAEIARKRDDHLLGLLLIMERSVNKD